MAFQALGTLKNISARHSEDEKFGLNQKKPLRCLTNRTSENDWKIHVQELNA